MPQAIPAIIQAVYYSFQAYSTYESYRQSKEARRQAAKARERMRGLNYTTRSSAVSRRIPYGRCRLGGTEIFASTTGAKNDYMDMIIVWADGPCEAIEKVYFGDEEVTVGGGGAVTTGKYAGLAWIHHHLGSPTQSADSNAVANISEWTSNHKLLGICYSYIRLKYDETVFVQGAPNISVVLRGRNDIYDPRTETSGWTDNAALCWAHYMSRARIGPNADYATEIDEEALIDAANISDESVALKAGGTERRYTVNGVIHLEDGVEEAIVLFREAMAGITSYIGGKWRCYPGVWREPTFEITADMVVGPISLVSRPGKRERFNTIKGLFSPEQAEWQPTDFPAVTSSAYKADDGEELVLDLSFPLTKSPAAVQRLAKIRMEGARRGRIVEVPLNIEGLRAQPGKTVMFTYPRWGFNQTPCDVLDSGLRIENNVVTVTLTLRETAEAVYDWDEDVDEQTFHTGSKPYVYDPAVVTAPTGLTATPQGVFYPDTSGNAITVMLLEWTPTADVFVEQGGLVEVAWKKSSAGSYNPADSYTLPGPATSVEIDFLEPDTSYDFTVRFVNRQGGRSSAATVTETTNAWDGTFDQARVATPEASPAGGTHPAIDFPLNVSLSTATAGATIRWSKTAAPTSATDGNAYSGPVSVDDGDTLYVRAFRTGFLDSQTLIATYTAV